jgi:hypothetical protein
MVWRTQSEIKSVKRRMKKKIKGRNFKTNNFITKSYSIMQKSRFP